MTDTDNFTAVAFFKCKSPIHKLDGNGYHAICEYIGENITFHRCYMRKFDKDELEGCFKQVKENSGIYASTCSYTGRENLN